MTTAKAKTTLLTEAQIARLEDRVVNWATWCRLGSSVKHTCASAERMYSAQAVDGEGFARKVFGQSVDTVDAELIERAVVGLPCQAHRAYLKLAYVSNRNARYITTRLRIRASELDSMNVLVLAQLSIVLADLERPVVIRRGKKLWAGLDGR